MLLLLPRCKVRLFARVVCYEDRYACSAAPCTETLQQQQHFSKSWRLCHCSSSSSFSSSGNAMQRWWKAAAASGSTGKRFLDRGGYCAFSCVRPPEAAVTPRGCSTRTSGRASFGRANTADSRLFKVPTTYTALKQQQQQRSRSRKARDTLGSTAGAGTANGAAMTSAAASASYTIASCWFSAQAEATPPPSGRDPAAVALVAGEATSIATAAAVAASALEAGTSAATAPGASSIAGTATAFFLSAAAAPFPRTASAAAQSPATATVSAGTLRVRESFFTTSAFSRPPVVFSRSLVTSPVTFGISPGASSDTSPRPPAAAASAASSPPSPSPPVPASTRPASSPSGSSQFLFAAKYCSPLAGVSASDIPDTATAHPASAVAAADCPSPPHHASAAAAADIASPWPATRGATTSPGCPPAATRERSPASSAFPSPVAAAEASAPSASSAAAALQSLPFYAAGRTMPGQRLLPVTPAEADLLCASVVRYPTPQEVEGGIIVRLVRRCDPVSSPVLRCIRNRQFGIRGSERWQLLCVGFAGAALLFGLGCWQLRRMREKRELIEYRRSQLRRKPVFIRAGPFPWTSGEAAQQQQQPQANERKQLLLQQGDRRLKGLHQRVQDHRRGETEEAQEGRQAQHQQIVERTTSVDPEQLAGSGAAVSEIWRRGVQSVAILASLFFQQLLSYVSVPAACADAASAVDREHAAAAGGSSTAATVVALPAVASALAAGLPAPAAASPLPVRDRRTAAAAREACHSSSLAPCSSSAAVPVASGAAENAAATCATPRGAPPTAAEAATPRGFATGRAALPGFSAATSGETNAVECFDSERSRGVAHNNTSLREEDVLREWSYRPVVVRGVLDTSVELKVGPRPGIENGSTGCCIISPLRLEDGQVLLVNKGHLLLPRARLPAFDRTQAVHLQRRQRLQQQREHGQQQAQESHFPGGSTGGSCSGESFSCSNRINSGRSSEGVRGLAGGGGREEERATAGAQAGAAGTQDGKGEKAERGRGLERLGETVAVASGWPGHVQETTPEWREEGEETDRSSSSGHGLTTRDEPPGWVTVRGVLEPGELLPNATARGLFSWMHAGNRPKENQFLYIVPKDLVEALAPRGIIRDAAATSMFVVNAYDILYDDDVLTALKKAELEQKRVKRLLEQQRQVKLQQHAPQQQQPREQQQPAQPPQTEETCLQQRQPEHQGTAAEAHQQTFYHAGEQDNRTGEHKQQQQEATEQERQGTYACHMAAARAERPRGLRIGGWFRDGHPRSSLLSYSPPSPAALVHGEIRKEEEESSAVGADSTCTVFGGTEANAQSAAAAETRPAATSATVRPPAVGFPSAASPRAAATASSVPFAPAASAPAASHAAAATPAAPVFFPRSIAAMFEHPTSLSALLRIPGVRRRFADYQQKRKDDYLLFWADEHTHFNYACQWFLMAVCCACMTLYKFIEVSRWKF